MSNPLILYFSRSGMNYVNGEIVNLRKGNTAICAEYIQNAVGGDLFEIETERSYSADYTECTQQAQAELKNGMRPKLQAYLEDISEYAHVFVLGPCWWGTYPMAVFSQLERLDFTGKKVMALMTHEGSGMGNSERDLHRLCAGAVFGTSMAVHGADVAKLEQRVVAWARKNIEA